MSPISSLFVKALEPLQLRIIVLFSAIGRTSFYIFPIKPPKILQTSGRKGRNNWGGTEEIILKRHSLEEKLNQLPAVDMQVAFVHKGKLHVNSRQLIEFFLQCRNQSELLIKLNCIQINTKIFEEKWEDQVQILKL